MKLNEKDKEDLRKEKDNDDEAARCRWHERAGPIAQAIALNFEYKEALNAMAAATNTLLEDDECLQLCTSLVAADSREEHRWWPLKNQQGQRWLCPKCVNNMWRTAAKAANIDAPKDVK